MTPSTLQVPLLQSGDAVARLGGVQGGSALVEALGPRLVPYAVLLVVPLLRCMSDPAPPVGGHTRLLTCKHIHMCSCVYNASTHRSLGQTHTHTCV